MPASERGRRGCLVVAWNRLCWCRLRNDVRSRPHGVVLAWLQAVDNANLQLASVSLGEIQAGIEITREQDAAKASAWAQLMHRRSGTLYEDAMIAALGIVG